MHATHTLPGPAHRQAHPSVSRALIADMLLCKPLTLRVHWQHATHPQITHISHLSQTLLNDIFNVEARGDHWIWLALCPHSMPPEADPGTRIWVQRAYSGGEIKKHKGEGRSCETEDGDPRTWGSDKQVIAGGNQGQCPRKTG